MLHLLFPLGETIILVSFLYLDSNYHMNFEKLISLLNWLKLVTSEVICKTDSIVA